jgi:hypothetical protein
MAAIYSTNFLRLGPGEYSTPTWGPSGDAYVAVLAHMTFSTGVYFDGFIGPGFQVKIGISGEVCWQIDAAFLQPNRTYQWEGREVLGQADTLFFETNVSGYSFAANGYLLTAP